MFNLQIAVGNLGADPERIELPGGKIKTVFSVATTDVWTDDSGEKKKKTEWHNVEAWDKLGEVCAKNLKKGRQVLVVGQHRTNRWEKDGYKFQSAFIRADLVKFLDKPNG